MQSQLVNQILEGYWKPEEMEYVKKKEGKSY